MTDPLPPSPLLDLDRALRSLVGRVPEVRTLVHALSRWMAEIANAPVAAIKPESTAADLPAHVPVQSAQAPMPLAQIQPRHVTPQPSVGASDEALRDLLSRFGNPTVSPKIEVTPTSCAPDIRDTESDWDSELSKIRGHLQLHLRAVKWGKECARIGFDNSSAEYHQLTEYGSRERVFFWELSSKVRDFPSTQWNGFQWRYSAVVVAIGLYLEVPRESFRTLGVLRLVASATTALLNALEALQQHGLHDSDCKVLVQLLGSHPRHRIIDLQPNTGELPFDGSGFHALVEKIRSGIREGIALKDGEREALRKLAYHLKLVRATPADAEANSASILNALNAYVSSGGEFSSPQLRALFKRAGVVDSLPQTFREDPLVAELLESIAEQQDDHASADETRPRTSRAPTAAILKVRAALRGRKLVLIGGDERPNRRDAIERAFELAEIDWVSTRPHEKHDRLMAQIRNPETAIVILMIRWASHSYGELGGVCAQYSKPFVRLPGGYNPSMIANCIIEQVGDRFGITPE